MPATGRNRRRPLPELLSTNDMDQLSTNIFEKITAFVAEKKMIRIIDRSIQTGEMSYPNRTRNAADFDSFAQVVNTTARPEIAKFIKDYNTMPAFLKTLRLNLDDANVMKDLIRLSRHQCALTNISRQCMLLKLQVLNRGEEAYDVHEKLNGMAKIGRRLDDPMANSRYFRKHPGFKRFMGTVRGTTKLAAFAAA
jgi:hypothetical protein